MKPNFDPKKLPEHIAIIMDGNGRWAQQRNLPRLEGHQRGSEKVEDIVEACAEIGIRYLTLYAFSQENWNRPDDEVDSLMELLRLFLIQKRPKLIQNQIRLLAIGQIDRLPEKVLRELTKSIKATSSFSKMTLTLALSYSSRGEIVDAVNALLRQSWSEENVAKIVSEQDLDRALYTEGRTPPDLLIRTSGEYRISNFLLWQMAYSELYFTDTLWPDFTRENLMKAIEEFQKRERRFGKTTDQIRQTA